MAVPTYQQAVIKLLCEIKECLMRLCDQPSCQPCQGIAGDSPSAAVALTSTGGTKILGVNPRRLGFIVNNANGSVAVYVGQTATLTTAARNAGVVAAGTVSYFTPFQFPASLTNEFYARAASGSPTVEVSEQNKP